MTVTTAPMQGSASQDMPGFGETLLSEWTKLRTVRSTWIIAGLAIVLSIGLSALGSLVSGLTFDSWGEDARVGFDPLLNGMAGLLFSMTLLIVFGVTAVTSEYGTRLIRTTLIVTPQRSRVFAAKAVIVGMLGMVVGAIATPGMYLVSQLIFDAYGLATVSVHEDGVLRYLVVYSLVFGILYTLIPFSIAFILRSAASGIVVSIGVLFLPWMLAPILPSWLQENVLRFFPDLAIDSLAGIMPLGSATYLSGGSAGLVLMLWIAGLLATSAFVLNRRDA